MTVGLVWAQARGGVIGADGRLPWHLPEDLAHFRQLTTGTTVVMGRLTWDSLPDRFRPLPDRRNVVLTRDQGWEGAGAEPLHDPAAVADLVGDVWVIGGAQVYAATLARAELAVVTEIDADYHGDVHAPVLDDGWRRTDRSPPQGWHESRTGLPYAVSRYVRTRPDD